jgi:nucleotide-binding universal stress UspA family protein
VFHRILVPLDGSENAERALPWALAYASSGRTPVVLTRVLDPIYPLKGMPFGEGSSEARAYLGNVARTFAELSVPLRLTLPAGPTARSIVECAVQERCGLIIMATRGNSTVVRWLVGGITEQVIRLSPIPILVVRSQTRPPGGPPPKRILIPLDGSSAARKALTWAIRLARHHGVSLALVHVVPGSGGRSRKFRLLKDQATGELGGLCARLREKRIPALFQVREGDAAEEILHSISSGDLVVLTTHGRSGLKRWILGSVAEKVIHEARVPVFIFKRFPESRVPSQKGDLAP